MENIGFPQEVAASNRLRLFGFDLNFSGNNVTNSSGDHHTNHQMLAKRKCPFCDKEFTNSQALGGHQNAHKKERLMRKKLEFEERKASIEFYLRSLDQQSSSSFLVYDSPTYGYYLSKSMIQPHLLFNPLPHPDSRDGPDLRALQIYIPY